MFPEYVFVVVKTNSSPVSIDEVSYVCLHYVDLYAYFKCAVPIANYSEAWDVFHRQEYLCQLSRCCIILFAT